MSVDLNGLGLDAVVLNCISDDALYEMGAVVQIHKNGYGFKGIEISPAHLQFTWWMLHISKLHQFAQTHR